MKRRNFIRGLFGGSAIAALGAVNARELVPKDLEGAPLDSDGDCVSLGRTERVEEKPASGGSISFFPEYRETGQRVSLAVGEDGNLWLNENGKWRRV